MACTGTTFLFIWSTRKFSRVLKLVRIISWPCIFGVAANLVGRRRFLPPLPRCCLSCLILPPVTLFSSCLGAHIGGLLSSILPRLHCWCAVCSDYWDSALEPRAWGSGVSFACILWLKHSFDGIFFKCRAFQ